MRVIKICVLMLCVVLASCYSLQKHGAELTDIKDETETKTVAIKDNTVPCLGSDDEITCTVNERDDVMFYLFATLGGLFGLMGMFLSLWMACNYVNRTYNFRDERLLPLSS